MEEEIQAKYKKLHDELTRKYYVEKSIDKETFEREHQKIWADMRRELKIPKRYRVYKDKITTAERTLYINEFIMTRLSDEEIKKLKELGFIIEEI